MIRRLFFLAAAALLPSVALAQSGLGPISPRTSSGSGTVTITAGTTATSGCTNGGFLYSLSSLVQCGANAINDGTTVTMGAILARTTDYASGSTVPLTVQCSLTGNCYDVKNSANTTQFSLSTGANMVWSSSVTTPSLQADAAAAVFTFRAGGASNNNTLVLNANTGNTSLSSYQQKNVYTQSFAASSTSAINSGHILDTSPGNTSAGFGTGVLLRGQSSTTASQDMVRLSGVWSDATHASRTSYAQTDVVTVAGSLAPAALDGVYKALTDNTIATFSTMTLGNDTGGGGTIHYCVYAADATTAGSECGSIDFAGVDVTAGAGGEVCPNPTKLGTPLQALSGSTLTVTFAATTGTDLCNLRVTADTDIATPVSLWIKWSAHNSGRVLTPQ